MKRRQTRQLVAVFGVVSAATDHPTAEEVHERVRRRQPRVSLGTVYRNLQKLAAQQRIRVVYLKDRAARYDGMVEDHDHFACESCGAVIDLLGTRAERPVCSELGRAGHSVRTHALTFYGRCAECATTEATHERRQRRPRRERGRSAA
jgi:Fe2+ or Zn2+ uptake regulation protein